MSSPRASSALSCVLRSPLPLDPPPSWLSYLALYARCFASSFLFSSLLPSLRVSLRRPPPPSYPVGSSINVGSPLTANHHFQFSVVQRLRATFLLFAPRPSSPSPSSSCPSSVAPVVSLLFERKRERGRCVAPPVKNSGNIISESEERLLTVPVGAAAAAAADSSSSSR